MQYHQPIRNTESPNSVKPRVFDVVIENDDVWIDVKTSKHHELIRLTVVLRQIEDAKRIAAKSEDHPPGES